MSYNPNGPRNTMGTGYGTTGTTGSGYDVGTSRTIPVTETEETAEGLRAKAEQLASTVKDKASQLGTTMSDKANAAVTTMGEKMADLGHSLRDRAPNALAPYADRAASGLERAGQYLQEGDLGDFVDDVAGIIRRHPIPAMLTGVAIGFLVARNSRR